MSDFAIEEGLPFPLGAYWGGKGTNFAVFSADATKVEVCLFDGERETHRLELPEYTDQVFHGYISGVAPGTLYGPSGDRHVRIGLTATDDRITAAATRLS